MNSNFLAHITQLKAVLVARLTQPFSLEHASVFVSRLLLSLGSRPGSHQGGGGTGFRHRGLGGGGGPV